MKRIVKVAAVGAAALGLVAGATPAEATPGAGAVAFIGSATVNPGLSTPTPGGGQDGTWSLSNVGAPPNAGVGVAVTAGASVTAGLATISASGNLHAGLVNVFGTGAFCGLSGGSGGTGTISVDDALSDAVSSVSLQNVGWFQSAATVIVFTGQTTFGATVGGALAGVVSAVPPIPGVIGAGSCSAGTATQFTVVGAGASTFTV